jgi:hypothetical protein
VNSSSHGGITLQYDEENKCGGEEQTTKWHIPRPKSRKTEKAWSNDSHDEPWQNPVRPRLVHCSVCFLIFLNFLYFSFHFEFE